MTAVQSLGSLANLETSWTPATFMWRSASGGMTESYPVIYRTNLDVRICVDFLARNIAQLGLHTYRRVSDTDRVRVTDHPLPELLERPNPFTTGYRFREMTMTDLGIWGNSMWAKVRRGGELALVRLDPMYTTVTGTLLVPLTYTLHAGGQLVEFKPEDVIHFKLPNPESAIWGLSPIESLRDLLAADGGQTDYRTSFWGNAARPGGIIERPLEAPEWSPEARNRFAGQFAVEYGGAENAGKTLVLEDGMHFVASAAHTAEESQAQEFRELTREDVARAYHIPPPMVGILTHATYSNIREQHKQLYTETLGPWLKMIEDDIELQLLPEFADITNLYVEFNIAEKLAGSFEEQSQALQTAVGRPWMSPDEARARLNLPSMGGEAEELGIPVNVRVGELEEPEPAVPLAAGGEEP